RDQSPVGGLPCECPGGPAAAAQRHRIVQPAPPTDGEARSADSGAARQFLARCAALPALLRASFQTAAFHPPFSLDIGLRISAEKKGLALFASPSLLPHFSDRRQP